MKIKTDLYTKIVLTTIAIALIGLLVKDMDFVTKAQATELDLSAMKIENASDAAETIFYLYDISSLDVPFGTEQYKESDLPPYAKSFLEKTRNKDINEAFFDNDRHKPKYMITNKKGSFWIQK